MRRHWICCAVVVGVTAGSMRAAPAAGLEAKGYRLTPSGVILADDDFLGSVAVAINNRGQLLVDLVSQSDRKTAIFTAAPRSLKELGTLPAPYNGTVNGTGLNDLGQASATVWSGGQTYHAAMYTGGPAPTMVDLGTLRGYGYASQANGINNAGEVVGDSETGGTSGSIAHAFIYSNHVMRDLGTLPGFLSSAGVAINDSGVAAGYSFGGVGSPQFGMAFISGPSGLVPLGTLPAPFNAGSGAFAINGRGDVVGASYDSAGHSHAFLWSNGVMTDLGTPPGFTAGAVPLSINDSGQITGHAVTADGGGHYFLYADGKMTDLSDLLDSAFDRWAVVAFGPINNAGQIAASGYGPGGGLQPVLLTPVPEPAMICVLAPCALLLRRRRGR